MDKTLTAPAAPAEGAKLEATVDEILVEIQRSTERMKSIQERTERLGAETRAMLAQLRAT